MEKIFNQVPPIPCFENKHLENEKKDYLPLKVASKRNINISSMFEKSSLILKLIYEIKFLQNYFFI